MAKCCGVVRASSREDPIVIGDPDGMLYRCRTLVSQFGLSYGAVGWFTGDGVPLRLAPLVRTLELVE